jgi:hypothetical protein
MQARGETNIAASTATWQGRNASPDLVYTRTDGMDNNLH